MKVFFEIFCVVIILALFTVLILTVIDNLCTDCLKSEKCKHGILYHVSSHGVYTPLINKDGKPLECVE